MDDDGFFGFLFFYIVIVGGLVLLFVLTGPKEPSLAVVQCVDSRMEILSEVDGMWSGESERAEMAEALEDFCQEVQ